VCVTEVMHKFLQKQESFLNFVFASKTDNHITLLALQLLYSLTLFLLAFAYVEATAPATFASSRFFVDKHIVIFTHVFVEKLTSDVRRREDE